MTSSFFALINVFKQYQLFYLFRKNAETFRWNPVGNLLHLAKDDKKGFPICRIVKEPISYEVIFKTIPNPSP